MDATRIEPSTHDLGSQRPRRAAVRALAGAALAGLPLLGPAAPAAKVDRRPRLPRGWSHLAGTTTGLLFCKASEGRAASGTFQDGVFVRKANFDDFAPDWSHVIGAGPSVYFYRASDGFAASGVIRPSGVFVQPTGSNYNDTAGWAACPGTRSGRFAMMGPEDLETWALTGEGRRAGGCIHRVSRSTGWTLLVGVGFNAVLLYNRATGAARTGRIDDVGSCPDAPGREYRWIFWESYDFAAGWTHVAGTFNGGLLFYRASDGFGATGFLDPDGAFEQTGNPSFGRGWTHLVGAGSRGVLFYNRRSGKGVGGYMKAGVWKKTATYG